MSMIATRLIPLDLVNPCLLDLLVVVASIVVSLKSPSIRMSLGRVTELAALYFLTFIMVLLVVLVTVLSTMMDACKSFLLMTSIQVQLRPRIWRMFK